MIGILCACIGGALAALSLLHGIGLAVARQEADRLNREQRAREK